MDPANAVLENQESNNTVNAAVTYFDPDPDPPVVSAITITEETGDHDGFTEDNEMLRCTWVATDAVSSVYTTSFVISNTAYPAQAQGGYFARFGPLPEGIYPYAVRATDGSSKTQVISGELTVLPHAVRAQSLLPAAGTTGVHPGDPIAAYFTTALKPDSLSSAFNVVAANGVPVTGRVEYRPSDRMATFVPLEELANSTTFTATLLAGANGIADEYDNRLESTVTWSFTTEPDTTSPVARLTLSSTNSLYNNTLSVFGSALDKNLTGYTVQYGRGANPISWTTVLTRHGTVADGYLGTWDTHVASDGVQSLRLIVSDTAGFSSITTSTVQVDNTPPAKPAVLRSTSHFTGTSSNKPVITVTWSAVTDALSGLAGYAVAWVQWPDAQPAPVVSLSPATLTATSPSLVGAGRWYFTLMSRDNAGNWSAPAYLGPFYINTLPPKAYLPLVRRSWPG